MTNPSPDFSAKVKLDSVQDDEQHSIGRLTVVSAAKADASQRFNDALVCPAEEAETTATAASGMDPLKASSPSKGLNSSNSSGGGVSILKKGEDPAKADAKKSRKITFLEDDKEKIVEDVFEYYFPPDVEQGECYWTDEELDRLLTEAMLMARHYSKKQKGWQNKIKLVLKACGGGKNKDGEPVKVKASDLDAVVDCDARGLELYIHPIFQKNRVKAIQGVIKVQADYNASEKKKGKADPELRLKVLKAQSLKFTNTAKMMAKTMADGDHRAAIKKDDEDSKMKDTNDDEAKVNAAENETSSPSENEMTSPSEEMVPSEELQMESHELEPRDFRNSTYRNSIEPIGEAPALRTRPMTHSPVRGSARPRGLQALRSQTNRLLGLQNKPGAGGITSLQISLDDLSDDGEK